MHPADVSADGSWILLSIPNFVIKKRRPRGHRFGKTKEQKDHHISHKLRKRFINKKFEGIHDRLQKDSTFRDSQVRTDRTEEVCIQMDKDAQKDFTLIACRPTSTSDTERIGGSQHIWTQCTDETPFRLQRSINKIAPSSPWVWITATCTESFLATSEMASVVFFIHHIMVTAERFVVELTKFIKVMHIWARERAASWNRAIRCAASSLSCSEAILHRIFLYGRYTLYRTRQVHVGNRAYVNTLKPSPTARRDLGKIDTSASVPKRSINWISNSQWGRWGVEGLRIIILHGARAVAQSGVLCQVSVDQPLWVCEDVLTLQVQTQCFMRQQRWQVKDWSLNTDGLSHAADLHAKLRQTTFHRESAEEQRPCKLHWHLDKETDCGNTCVTRMRKSECSDTKGDWPTTKFIEIHWRETARGALLTKGADSSFAEAHRRFTSEPTHIEDEVEDLEDEEEDGWDCEACKVESRREVRHTQPSAWNMDGMTRTNYFWCQCILKLNCEKQTVAISNCKDMKDQLGIAQEP